MRIQKLSSRFIVITFCLAIISLTFSMQVTQSQEKPLSLAAVLTGLQSKSGGFTLSQKNDFITRNVLERGITFRLTPELERELISAGASTALIRAIREKSSRTRPTPRPSVLPDDEKPSATYEKVWVKQNVVEKGIKGIHIYANFNLYHLKEVQSDLIYRFQKDGQFLKTEDTLQSNKAGELVGFRLLKPAFSATVYEELIAFVPYSAIALPPGVHNLKLDMDVNLRDGTIVKHLDLIDLRLVMPAPTLRKTSNGSATFDKISIDYKIKENGVWGMRIHIKMVVRDLEGEDAYMRILFTKDDDTLLRGKTSEYTDTNGQSVAFVAIRPVSIVTNFNDLSVFVPYSEFDSILPKGKHLLKLHADLVSSDYQKLSHLTFERFSFTKG